MRPCEKNEDIGAASLRIEESESTTKCCSILLVKLLDQVLCTLNCQCGLRSEASPTARPNIWLL